MADYTISISDTLYEKAQRIAAETSQPVDEVIRKHLSDALNVPMLDIPVDEQAELKAMAYLSDDALWTIAREQMQSTLQERMSVLMAKNSLGTISEGEHTELSALVDRGERLTLRKARAMKLLIENGHNINLDDLKLYE